MFSVRELAGDIDKTATFQIHGLAVDVRIKDVRKVFDRVDCLVEPVSGKGESWVSRSALAF